MSNHCLLGRKGSKKRSSRPRGKHTTSNVWDDAADLNVWRGGEKLDPGVNYFVLMLDQMGLPTSYSCEGHPDGFYITFHGPYQAALDIHAVGFFSVQVESEEYWSLRRHIVHTPKETLDAFRWAAKAWEEQLGPLDLDKIILKL